MSSCGLREARVAGLARVAAVGPGLTSLPERAALSAWWYASSPDRGCKEAAGQGTAQPRLPPRLSSIPCAELHSRPLRLSKHSP